MKGARRFELEVLPQQASAYGLALVQRAADGRSRSEDSLVQVARIWGPPLEAVLDRVLETLRGNGFRAGDLKASRQVPFALREESGVRLGVLFLAVKPLRRLDRIAAISEAIRHMEPEEAYYWFAKCSRSETSRRGCRALRILLAEE